MRQIGNNISITINNLSVSYNDHGPESAPVIIFIHAFPLNKSMWEVQMDALKSKYRVIAYDIRGHGNSEAGIDDFFIELFVKDLLRFMEKLGVLRSILCGLSLGGYIAIRAVLKHPDRFDGLILNDTQCIADTLEIKENRCAAIIRIRKDGVEKYADEVVKNLFASETYAKENNIIASVKEMIAGTSKQSLCNTLHALADREDTCDDLHEINIPVLIMVGKEDKITPIAAAQQMHEKIRGSVLKVIQHAGHIINLENPIAFGKRLVKFLELVDKKIFYLSEIETR